MMYSMISRKGSEKKNNLLSKSGVQREYSWTKLGLLLHAIHSHLRKLILLSPMVLLDLRFLDKQLNVGGGLALFSLSICLHLKVALFFLLLLFIY
jgi:hypothetical protein